MDLSTINFHESIGETVPVRGLVFFQARDGEHGEELWVSDGTAGETRMVFDLLPGGNESDSLAYSDPNLVVLDNAFLFTAWNGTERKRNFYKLALRQNLHVVCQDVTTFVDRKCETNVDPDIADDETLGEGLVFSLNITTLEGLGLFPVEMTVQFWDDNMQTCFASITLQGICFEVDDDASWKNGVAAIAAVVGGILLFSSLFYFGRRGRVNAAIFSLTREQSANARNTIVGDDTTAKISELDEEEDIGVDDPAHEMHDEDTFYGYG